MIFTSSADNCHSSHLDTTHHAWFTNNSSTTDLTVASFHKQIGAKDMMMHKHGLGRKLAQERARRKNHRGSSRPSVAAIKAWQGLVVCTWGLTGGTRLERQVAHASYTCIDRHLVSSSCMIAASHI